MRWILWCFCLLAESYETINQLQFCCVNGFRLDSHLDAFHFGSSPMVALVKGPLFYFLQMFPNLCVQIYSFGSCLGVRFKYIFTKPSALYYTFIVCYCHITGVGWTTFQIWRSTDEPVATTDLLETKFWIVAHWLVKYVNRIFSGFGCVAIRIRIPTSWIRTGVGLEKTWVRTPLLSGLPVGYPAG